MGRKAVICSCQSTVATGGDFQQILNQFGTLRMQCSAISQILVPDEIWTDFKRWANYPADGASHQSILILAYERDYLQRITYPIHRFLLDSEGSVYGLSSQYKNDLQEVWLTGNAEELELKRHKVFKKYMGKLSELMIAAWLEDHSWDIRGLEARGADGDIIARSPENSEWAIEVKRIDENEGDFNTGLQAMYSSESTELEPGDLYTACDYLISRVFEAARQLQKHTRKSRMVLIVLAPQAFNLLEIQIDDNWIDWACPKFENENPNSRFWLDLKMKNEPDFVIKNVSNVIDGLHELWIVKESNSFAFERMRVEKLPGNPWEGDQ